MFSIVGNQVVMLEKAYGGEDDYRRVIRAAVRGLWGGELNIYGFMDSMSNAIRRGFTRAWYEGMATVGLRPEDQNAEERAAMNSEINSEILHILGFGNAIAKNDKANGGLLAPLLKRAEMWTNRYSGIRSQAMVMAGRDAKLKWVYGPTEHCADCERLNGRVYRASIWQKYNIRPRMRRLACTGRRCLCSLIVTSDPVTPGRPPAI